MRTQADRKVLRAVNAALYLSSQSAFVSTAPVSVPTLLVDKYRPEHTPLDKGCPAAPDTLHPTTFDTTKTITNVWGWAEAVEWIHDWDESK